jgi:hypothetical protein
MPDSREVVSAHQRFCSYACEKCQHCGEGCDPPVACFSICKRPPPRALHGFGPATVTEWPRSGFWVGDQVLDLEIGRKVDVVCFEAVDMSAVNYRVGHWPALWERMTKAEAGRDAATGRAEAAERALAALLRSLPECWCGAPGTHSLGGAVTESVMCDEHTEVPEDELMPSGDAVRVADALLKDGNQKPPEPA